MTFPRSTGQIPLFYNPKNTGRPMDPNNKYTSKYLDMPNTPLYPFGFGMSYTTFTYSDLAISQKSFTPTDLVKIQVTVTNTGKYDGEETVQLYVRDLVGSVTRPIKELKGFQKVFLKKGAQKTVTFTLSAKDLRFYDSQLRFKSEPGTFEIWVGGDSNASLNDKITLIE